MYSSNPQDYQNERKCGSKIECPKSRTGKETTLIGKEGSYRSNEDLERVQSSFGDRVLRNGVGSRSRERKEIQGHRRTFVEVDCERCHGGRSALTLKREESYGSSVRHGPRTLWRDGVGRSWRRINKE